MMTVLFLLGLLLFTILAWKKLEQATLLLVLLLPTYLIRFSFGIPVTLLEMMIVIVFGVWCVQNRLFFIKRWQTFKNGSVLKSLRAYPFRWPLTLWLLVSFLAVGLAGWNNAAFGIWKAYFFEPALLFIVVINVFKTKDKLICLLGSFGLSAVAVSAFALYQYVTGDFIPNEFWANSVNRRATSFFPFPNAVGLYLGPIILLATGHLSWLLALKKSFKEHQWQYIGAGLAIVLGLVALVAARSEGAILAVGASLLLFGLLANKLSRKITIGVIVAGLLVFATVTPVQTYMTDKLLLRDFSGQVRRAQWHETWQMLKAGRLVTGAGLAQYQATITPYHQEGIFVKDYHDPDFQRKVVFNEEFRNSVWQPLEIYLYPHNVILNFWTELGLAGVVIFLWLVILFFYYGFRAWWQAQQAQDSFSYITLGLTLALLVSLIHGVVDVPYFKNDLAALFWILMAMMGVVSLLFPKQLHKK